MGANAKTRQKKPRMSIRQIEEALRACGGVYSAAAQRLGCAPNTVRNYVNRTPKLQKAVEDICERNVDLAESALMMVLRNPKHPKHVTACIFFLKTQGRHRGYVEKQEVDAKVNGTVSLYKVHLPEEEPEDGQ